MLLIFDLDGTLIDSRLDLANAVNAALAYMKHKLLPNEVIYRYVGNGARVLMQRSLGAGADPVVVEKAHAFFIDYYSAHAVEQTTLYDGVAASLESLRSAGHQLAVLTNKPVQISHQILDGLNISSFFFDLLGGNSLQFQKPNPIGIDTLRGKTGASKQDTWMVGDSWVDIETARNAGVASCGVTYGLQPYTFATVPPDFLAPTFAAFAAHIQSLPRT